HGDLPSFPTRRSSDLSQVSWRIGRKSKDGKRAALLAYIDARDVMERLDKAVGPGNWQNRYTLAADGLLICEIGIRVDGEWIWRADRKSTRLNSSHVKI